MIPENNRKLLIELAFKIELWNQSEKSFSAKARNSKKNKTIALSIQLEFQQRRASFIQITI